MEINLDQQFWENKYRQADTPWETGTFTPALINYLRDKPRDARVLIPGAGTSKEVIELIKLGFTHITLCDISPTAMKYAKEDIAAQFPNYPVHFYLGDFFALTGEYDFIMEQTFFCALPTTLRTQYIEKMFNLLAEGGTLFGVLFASPFQKKGPPFGGDIFEYKSLFDKIFYIKEISMCNNSIPPRSGNELFFICKKLVKP